MRENIFESKTEPPRVSNDAEVLRSALSVSEARSNMMPGMSMPVDRNVKSIERARRGHGY